jgi:hypothetical protein
MPHALKQVNKLHWQNTDDGLSTIISGTKAAAGDNELVAAPGAGKYIVVDWFLIQNESAVSTTMILKNGAAAGPRILAALQGDGLSVFKPWKLAANTALNLNLSGANSCGYTVCYHIE